MDKRGKFGAKAQTILDPKKKNLGGLGDFLKDDDIEEPIKKVKTVETQPSKNTEIRKSVTPKKFADQKEKLTAKQPIIVRHELHLEEGLSEKIRAFQFFNKEKNRTRFFKIILNDFFSKSEDQQTRTYQKWLKKIEP